MVLCLWRIETDYEDVLPMERGFLCFYRKFSFLLPIYLPGPGSRVQTDRPEPGKFRERMATLAKQRMTANLDVCLKMCIEEGCLIKN